MRLCDESMEGEAVYLRGGESWVVVGESDHFQEGL